MSKRDVTLFRYRLDLQELARKRREWRAATGLPPERGEAPEERRSDTHLAETFRETEEGRSLTTYLKWLASAAVAVGLAYGGYRGYRWWGSRGEEAPVSVHHRDDDRQRPTDPAMASLVGFLFLLGTTALVRKLRLVADESDDSARVEVRENDRTEAPEGRVD